MIGLNELLAVHDAHEHRVYLDNDAREYAIVDAIDYQWAIRWCWCAKRDPGGGIYARRAVGDNSNGMRLRTFTLYLHVEINRFAHSARDLIEDLDNPEQICT